MKEYNKQYVDELKKKKKHQELFEYLSSFTESDNAVALNALALCYYNGWGTEKNYNITYELDVRAAKSNNPDSLATLGFDFQYGVGVDEDIHKAVALYTQAAEADSANGLTYLGVCYEYGKGVHKDEAKAFELYCQAAEKDFGRAQRYLGICYEDGIGTSVDKEKAVEWYMKAAEQEDKVAQRLLGNCYKYGIGVKENIEKAIEWYSKAIENNDIIAKVLLAGVYYDDYDDEEKDKLAFEYFQKAIQELSEDSFYYYFSCYKLAFYYENGYLVDFDPVQAFEYMKIAAEGEIEQAFCALAAYYEDGFGTQVNKSEAIKWYEKGVELLSDALEKAGYYITIGDLINEFDSEEMKEKAKQCYDKAYGIYLDEANNGNGKAMLEIGRLFFAGKGPKKDYSQAFKYFEKADIKLSSRETKFWMAKCRLYGFGINKDEKKAFKLLVKAARDEEPSNGTVLLLIYCYLNGIGTRKNKRKAQKNLVRFSRENEFAENTINFYKGILYYHGVGVKKNIDKAKKYFAMSDSGSVTYLPFMEGNYIYAEILALVYTINEYAANLMIVRDEKRAKEFLKIAYEKKVISESGITRLCDLMRTRKERKQTYQILSDSITADSRSAKNERLLAQHLYYGYGCKKNIGEAIKHFYKAFEQGDDIAKVYLARCYADGKGVEQNYEAARNILMQDSKNGGITSDVLRGLLIYSGKWGFKKNKEEGLALIKAGAYNESYKAFYDYLSGLRGEFYSEFFYDAFFAKLLIAFDKKSIIKYIPLMVKMLFLLITKNPDSANLTKKEMLRILLSQNQEKTEQGQKQLKSNGNLSDLLNQIKTNTDNIPQIIEQQKEIADSQKEIIASLHSIVEYVAEQKKSLPNENSLKYLDEEQIEQIQARFVEETASKIIASLQGNTSSIEREEALLKGMFSDHWMKMDDYTRKSLVSARVLFDRCKSPEFATLDHSGVVVSVASALENELKKRLFIGYKKFVENKLGLPDCGKWPQSLAFCNKNGDIVEKKIFTLGSLPYLFKCSDEEKELLSEYLQSILSENYVSLGIYTFVEKQHNKESFVTRCENVRVSYRNAAAHTEIVDRAKAECCCNAVIGPNEASEKIGQIQGLLYDLVQMTGNFKDAI